MAMRGRGGSSNNANRPRPPRLIVNRVFEQFKPMSEWRQEDGYDTLLVYLPGFQKENIKVTTEGVNIVRVRGERLVSENKWSRFQEHYRVPVNCEMSGISARFDGGILTITMPRKNTNAPPPLPPTAVSRSEDNTLPPQPKPTSKSAQTKQPSKPQTTQALPPQSKPTSSSATTKQQPLNTRLEDKTLPPQPKPTSSSAPTKQPSYTRLEDKSLPPQPKPTSSSTPTKQPPSGPAPEANEARGGFEHKVEKPNVGKKMDLDRGKGKEAILKEETKRHFEDSKGNPNISVEISGSLQGILARRGLVNEDRKLLINVGVGVLMIAALGVHVSYIMGLIGKEK